MDTNDEQTTSHHDVVIIGGGAAGLSAALTLGRARRSVLVIDAGSPRNAPADGVHNYLGQEGTPPGELLAIGRDEVARYGGQVVTDRVTSVERLDDEGFRVSRAGGPPVTARRLLVTTGLTDDLPDVEGLADRWGRDVIHCPYCHGWEVRDQPIAIIGLAPMAVHQARLWHQWTADLTLVLHDDIELSAVEAEQLQALGIEVVEEPAVALEVADDRIRGVRVAGGRVVACRHVVVGPRFSAQAALLADLGLEPVDMAMDGHVIGTHIAADPMGATAVPGVWVAGNVTDPMATVIAAAAAGLKAAHAISLDLITADTAAAVAKHRTNT